MCKGVKDKDKCDNYFEKLNNEGIDYTQIDTENFKFVVGIIQMTKTINYKDKILYIERSTSNPRQPAATSTSVGGW